MKAPPPASAFFLNDGEGWHHHIPEVSAIQACAKGAATPEQAKLALEFIVYTGAQTYQTSYRPGPGWEGETAFAEGRRHVGNFIVTAQRRKIGELQALLKQEQARTKAAVQSRTKHKR